MRAYLKATTALAALAAAGGGVSGVAFAADAPSAASSVQIEEVVVTASRREEKMQSVPIAVEALSAKSLDQLGVTNFSDLINFLPDVHDAGRGPGQQAVYIRGISTDTASIQASTSAGASPSVAIYLDDAPVSLPGHNLDVYAADLERVEVLEGPQGTLFGASSMGGSVRYITNKPNLSEFQVSTKVSYAETRNAADSDSLEVMFNIPVFKDKFAVRAVVFEDTAGGYINNVPGTFQLGANAPTFSGGSGANFNRTPIDNNAYVKNDFNPTTYRGARFEAAYQINDDWRVDVQDMMQTLQADGVFQYNEALGLDNVQRYQPDSLNDKFNQAEWQMKGKINQISLVYNGSFLNRKIDQHVDYTAYSNVGTYVVYYTCASSGSTPSPTNKGTCYTPAMNYIDHQQNQRFTEELRASTPSDWRLRALGGVYFDETRIYDDSDFVYQGSVPAGYVAPSPIPGTPQTNPNQRGPGTGFFNDILRSEDQKAVFGEVAYDIIPNKLTASAGFRYYDQSVGLRGTIGSIYGECAYGANNQVVAGSCSPPPAGGVYGVNLDSKLAGKDPSKSTGVIPRFNLEYKFSPDVMVYTTYTEGFRPGGFNRKGGADHGLVPYAYGSDNLRSYEFGWKTEWFEHSLQVNGSVYQEDWSKIQTSFFDEAITNTTFIMNAADAIIRGTELNVIWRPIKGLTLSSNTSLNDTKLTKVSVGGYGASALGIRPVGSELGLTPPMESTASARYEHALSGDFRGFVQLSGNFTGHRIASIIAQEGAYEPPDYNLKAYYLLNGSVGVMKDNWSAELYVTNLTNQHPNLFISFGDDVRMTNTSRPFTAGVRLNYKM